METINLPFFGRANELAWFNESIPFMMASLVIALVLGFASQVGLRIIRNTSQAIELINSIKPKQKSFKHLAIAEETANEELTQLAKDYGADRACIMLFHNGRHSLGRVDLLNCSIKAEGGSGRYPLIGGRIQNVPMLSYGNWSKRLSTGKNVEAPDAMASAMEHSPDSMLELEQDSVKSFYVYPVMTPSGEIDGCVFVQYCQAQRELGDAEKEVIRARGQSIYTKLHEANNV